MHTFAHTATCPKSWGCVVLDEWAQVPIGTNLHVKFLAFLDTLYVQALHISVQSTEPTFL